MDPQLMTLAARQSGLNLSVADMAAQAQPGAYTLSRAGSSTMSVGTAGQRQNQWRGLPEDPENKIFGVDKKTAMIGAAAGLAIGALILLRK